MSSVAAVSPHPYSQLTPERVLDAVEAVGYQADARIFPLNSFENRVYQLGLETGGYVVVKFYRPGRWSRAQILEEHGFTAELARLEVPVVAPIPFPDRGTLLNDGDFDFAVFPHFRGRPPELDDLDNLLVMGRFIGRIHAVGVLSGFQQRRQLGVEEFAQASREFLLAGDFIPVDLRSAYETLTADLLARMQQRWREHGALELLRIHGDCHPGNVLWRDETPNFVDFDDCLTGPAIQDLWMLLSGSRDQRQAQLLELVEGYNEFHQFRASELSLVEVLRTMRLMHYAAWLARRWQDPAFPQNFPWFNSPNYWAGHILELREQLSALDEPPLQLF